MHAEGGVGTLAGGRSGKATVLSAELTKLDARIDPLQKERVNAVR